MTYCVVISGIITRELAETIAARYRDRMEETGIRVTVVQESTGMAYGTGVNPVQHNA